ncbi:MAG: hypothetical protein EOM76_02375 [Sphingobacteriia bacterium]|jgi:uncharacterized protein|nr:hypothetical protein [Sphingobacteriia bacterium]
MYICSLFVLNFMEKAQIRVIGISENKVSSEFLLLLLGEIEGERKFPILIGKTEANAISMKLHGIEPPRPLIYNVMLDCASRANVSLQEAMVYKIEKEIFYTKLIWRKEGETFETEARISDGIALAIYAKRPIFIDNQLLNQLCQHLAQSKNKMTEKTTVEDMNETELTDLLQKCIDNEDYEQAAKIRDAIEQCKNTNK